MDTLRVDLKEKSYNIYIGDDSFIKIKDYIKKYDRFFIIADSNAFYHHGKDLLKLLEQVPTDIYFVVGEKDKSLVTIEKILERMALLNISRSDCILSFGGGVCGDISGFCASTYMRGIDYYQIPTTLLSQVDSSVGGKCGVNLTAGKNLVGSFYQPKGVFINKEVLITLDKRQIACGKSEVIKTLALRNEELPDELVNYEVISKCVNIKREIVEKDEFDLGLRMTLNFGHTIGHAIEKENKNKRYTHGHCVAIGMALITKMSEKAELTESGTYTKLINILKKNDLPYEYEGNLDGLFKFIENDKKKINNMLNLVLLKKIGEVYIHRTSIDDFKKMLGI